MLPILPRNSMKSCKCKKTTVMSYLPRLVTSLKKELLLMITKEKFQMFIGIRSKISFSLYV